MRWERIYDDAAALLEAEDREELEAMVDELSDEAWASISWSDELGGLVDLNVVGVGRVGGVVTLVTDHVVHLQSDRGHSVIARSAVQAVHAGRRRLASDPPISRRLDWRHVLRAARQESSSIDVTTIHGDRFAGQIGPVGADFVTLTAGVTTRVTLAHIALVRFED